MSARTEKPPKTMDCVTVAGTAGLFKRFLTEGSDVMLEMALLILVPVLMAVGTQKRGV